MGRRRHTAEQIITALREAEVGLANGKTAVPSSTHPLSESSRGSGSARFLARGSQLNIW